MGIRFNCQHCGKVLNVKSSLGGKRGLCPFCQGKIVIPAESGETQLAGEATVPATASQTTPAQSPTPVAPAAVAPSVPVGATSIPVAAPVAAPTVAVAVAEPVAAVAAPVATPLAVAVSTLPMAAPVAVATPAFAIDIDAAPTLRRRPASTASLVVIGVLCVAVAVLSYFVFQVVRDSASASGKPSEIKESSQ